MGKLGVWVTANGYTLGDACGCKAALCTACLALSDKRCLLLHSLVFLSVMLITQIFRGYAFFFFFFSWNVKQRHFPLYLSIYWYLQKQTITLSSLKRTVAALSKKLVYVACSLTYSAWRVHGSMCYTNC